MVEDTSFNVFHSCGVKVNHVRFNIPWKILARRPHRLSFHNFVGRIIEECDLKIEEYFPSILYINLEGDHVQLSCDEDEYSKFLDFILHSKERGHEFVHLIIPDFDAEGIEERGGSIDSERKELNLQDLNDMFSVNVDDKNFSRIHKSLRDLSANIWLPQPTSSSRAAYPEQTLRNEEISSTHGMLNVKRIYGKDVPWFLANGSRILVPTQDGDYLSVSISKNCEYAPYKFFSWQNGEAEPSAPEYRCQEMKIPVSVKGNSIICISDESKNLITNVVAGGQSISQEIEGLNQKSIGNDTHSLTKPNVELEEEIPPWFHRHMKEFKKGLVADLKTDLMNDIKKMLLSYDDLSKIGHKNTLLMNGENSFESACEEVPQLDAEKNEQDWDVVNTFSDNEINENSHVEVNRCNHPKENELNSLQAADAECEREHELESSNCVAGECYDSDSSVSIILDEPKIGDGDVSADSASSFIDIPRCFVSQLKDASPSGVVTVPVRVKKRRSFKVIKSSVSSTRRQAHPVTSLSFNSSSNLLGSNAFKSVDGEKLSASTAKPRQVESDGTVVPEFKPRRMENNIETSPGKRKSTAVLENSDLCRPAASPPPPPPLPQKLKEGENFAGADTSQLKTSASTYAESEPTQPLNILPDKIFEMTNNVFKNVLNSVKIPHSSEVKESVQKVFEESMSAASRLIPNPLLDEALPSSVNLDIPSTSSAAAAAAAATAATVAAAATTENAPSSTSTSVSDSTVNSSQWRTNEQSDVLRDHHDLPADVRMNLTILNEMGFNNNGHNLFLLTKYPDDLEKVVDSLVNFYSPLV